MYNNLLKQGNTMAPIKHGMYGTKEYKVWSAMEQRCNNPKNQNYERYGGRGIAICDEWEEFINFYNDMGDANGLTLDREDNDLGYNKDNCRWVTRKEQSNNIHTNVTITYNNETKTVGEWSDVTGINIDVLRWRVNHNWSPDKIIETAIGTPKTQSKFTKAVVQYSLNKDFIAEHKSITEARKATGVSNTSIGYCCKDRQKTAGGFIWQYKEK